MAKGKFRQDFWKFKPRHIAPADPTEQIALEVQTATCRMVDSGISQDPELERYDFILSKKRLERVGFHPAVTSKTAEQIQCYYQQLTLRRPLRPSEAEYRLMQISNSRALTMALLVFRHNRSNTRRRQKGCKSGSVNQLSRLLDLPDIGGQICEAIFAAGSKAVNNVAITSTSSWISVFNSSRIWDYYAHDFCTYGPARIFVAVAPEYLVQELNNDKRLNQSVSSWAENVKLQEAEIGQTIIAMNQALKQDAFFRMEMGELTDEIMRLTAKIKQAAFVEASNQFNQTQASLVFHSGSWYDLLSLRKMLDKIWSQRSVLRVLYLCKIPLLDRRIVAIILRACPNIQMVGIYDCPLIHFGDVICLLDLIHQVNSKRRKQKFPLITSFDFFPRYHCGMPFQHECAETYGLTWAPHALEPIQRGFFAILLKAFMKAKRMKLDLFDKGKSWRDFLSRVPNYSLAVPAFLDALYRQVDWQAQRREKRSERVKNQILFDLLKPVRLGLDENIVYETQFHGKQQCEIAFWFCASCGYEMLSQFFSQDYQGARPTSRFCAGCDLQSVLDREEDHLKQAKLAVLRTLFPDWQPRDFNVDAPLAPAATGIIKLKSIATKPPLSSVAERNWGLKMDDSMLVRDYKSHNDSLQRIPSLQELVGSDSLPLWTLAIGAAKAKDIYARVVYAMRIQCTRVQDDGTHVVLTRRADGALPDHAEECQPSRFRCPKPENYVTLESRSLESAAGFDKFLKKVGFI
ncbi:hypothetical protein CDD81_4376 [Ophiocordyceps australis]|uniref:Uncharacterized protein n=1 Tax=Ophiocordyceps australis TaxID=1399860 RepID=A0A2C5YJ98_9HYPO|nr:hypothetical protein CDD81_4376 [Ophiocordyceps australis]